MVLHSNYPNLIVFSPDVYPKYLSSPKSTVLRVLYGRTDSGSTTFI